MAMEAVLTAANTSFPWLGEIGAVIFACVGGWGSLRFWKGKLPFEWARTQPTTSLSWRVLASAFPVTCCFIFLALALPSSLGIHSGNDALSIFSWVASVTLFALCIISFLVAVFTVLWRTPKILMPPLFRTAS
jgi:hypothetical protein